VKAKNSAADQVRLAVQDSYKRLLGSAIEVELRMETKKRADAEAIRVFAENLRELLLASPLGNKNVLAIEGLFTVADLSKSASPAADADEKKRGTVKPATPASAKVLKIYVCEIGFHGGLPINSITSILVR
jgi:hypothetical protein